MTFPVIDIFSSNDAPQREDQRIMSDPRFHYPEALVSGDWLEASLEDPQLRIFDCTFYLVYEEKTGRPYRVVSGREDYEKGHVPGSGFLDLQEDFSVAHSPYRFTLPTPEYAGSAFARFGLGDDHRAILYSRDNMQRATRFWWMLRWLGFDNAAVLDGGFDKWSAEGRPISTAPCAYPSTTLSISPRPELFVDKEGVQASMDDPGSCVINALEADLHSGANPRYGRPGRIPGSVNVPAASLVDSNSKEMKSPGEVVEAFASVGADRDKRIITYCGGGIAATLDAFLLHQLGYENISVYDNSMSEWASDPSLPIETD
jgi:thiosulfate/3-mercaptopyruvate sulfurtransferase